MHLFLKRFRLLLALISILLMGISLAILASISPMITVCQAKAAPVSQTVSEFSVVSYNIQARPVLDPCSEKAPLIGAKLKPFDLIGLQEAFSGTEALFQSAQPLHSVYFGRRRHLFKLVNSGLAILTRFPMKKSHGKAREDRQPGVDQLEGMAATPKGDAVKRLGRLKQGFSARKSLLKPDEVKGF